MSAESQTSLFNVSGYYESQSSRDRRLGLDQLISNGNGSHAGPNGAHTALAETAEQSAQESEGASAREILETELEMGRAIGLTVLATEINLL